MNRERNRIGRSGGFTLLELMVVVALIVILIAILIPAVSAAKRRAKITETTAEMAGISTSIDQYYQVFNAYPGPATAAQTTANNLTGTQNLLLGLCYGMKGSNTGMTAPSKVPPTNTYYVDAANPTSVQDWSNTDANGNPRSYPAFFTLASNELSPATGTNTWPAGGINGVTGGWLFPTILDRFNDPLPILYYRATPGVDGTATVTGNKVTAQPGTAGTPPITVLTGATGASYFVAENAAYTGTTGTPANLVSPSGATLPQSGTLNDVVLAYDVATISPTGVASARGGYVLISAGPDRVYGTVDDIIQVGGSH